jgi:uncharacterized protein YceH (UPF0502 family)
VELTAEQARVFGCLIEKAATTPDNYPLSTNSLVSACNQKSSRDPVMALSDRDVDAAMLALREQGMARTITGSGRTAKHRHIAEEALSLSPAGLAVISVLLLRGPQTVGEIRTRTERQHDFASLDGVDDALEGLANRTEPLVMQLEREPGRKEQRWAQLLCLDEAAPAPLANPAPAPAPSNELSELKAELAQLTDRVNRLYELLGET